MRGREDLFHLIKSLSKSEKRYFTLDAQKSGRDDSRYLELFKAINQQEAYNEESLQLKFGKGLSDDKARLYEAILRSMRDYRSAKSYAARIKEMLLDAKFLYERGLYDQCEERLDTARTMAYQLSDNLAILEILKEQRRIWKDTKPKGFDQLIEALIQETEVRLEYVREESNMLNTYDMLLIEILKNPQKNISPQRDEILKRYNHILARQHNPPVPLQAQLRFFQSIAFIYQLAGDTEQVYDCFYKVVQCWNANPKFKEEEFYRYILDFSNLLNVAFINPSHTDDIPLLLAQLEQEKPVNYHDKSTLFQKLTISKLVYYSNFRPNAPEVPLILASIDKGLSAYDLSPSSYLVILFNAATLTFLVNKFDLCQEWLDKIAQKGKKTSVRQDIVDSARIINLIVVFEQDDIEALDNEIRSVQRYFSQKPYSIAYNFSKLVIDHLKEISAASTREAKQISKALLEDIQQLRATQPIPLGLDGLLQKWIDGRY